MYKGYRIEQFYGDETDVFYALAPFVMDKQIINQFDGYPIFTDKDYVWFIVYDQMDVIAWASLKVKKNTVKFMTAYVKPEYRHKGIHTELIGQRMDWCEKNGRRIIEVDCLTTSVNQYKKLGFSEIKTFQKWHKLIIELITPEELGI